MQQPPIEEHAWSSSDTATSVIEVVSILSLIIYFIYGHTKY